MTFPRYAAKVDDNHAELVRLWRGMGAYVVDCSHVGEGFPDVLICWRGRLIWAELKDGEKSPSRRKLTGDQVVFHAEAERAGCPVHVIKNETEALALLGARRGV